MNIQYEPIGVVHSPFTSLEGMPIQPSRGRCVHATVEVYSQFEEGLQDLEGFSHIMLLCHFHRAKAYRLKVVPFLDTELRGLFATRAPSRPNPIGLSVVRLIRVDKNILSIQDVDLLDGTPVLDIKPYVNEFDEREDPRMGWLERVRKRRALSDDRFSS
jgi:tRNA-Thr(GGU) m(6)t(6)A37 methyltransferase TsaA